VVTSQNGVALSVVGSTILVVKACGDEFDFELQCMDEGDTVSLMFAGAATDRYALAVIAAAADSVHFFDLQRRRHTTLLTMWNLWGVACSRSGKLLAGLYRGFRPGRSVNDEQVAVWSLDTAAPSITALDGSLEAWRYPCLSGAKAVCFMGTEGDHLVAVRRNGCVWLVGREGSDGMLVMDNTPRQLGRTADYPGHEIVEAKAVPPASGGTGVVVLYTTATAWRATLYDVDTNTRRVLGDDVLPCREVGSGTCAAYQLGVLADGSMTAVETTGAAAVMRAEDLVLMSPGRMAWMCACARAIGWRQLRQRRAAATAP